MAHDWNNLNVFELYSFITRNRVCDFKIMQYFMKKNQCMSLCGLILWYPHVITFFYFFLTSWLCVYIYIYIPCIYIPYMLYHTMLCSSLKYGRIFSPKRATKKAFHGGDFWGKIYGEGYTEGLMIRSDQSSSSKMHFSIICKSINCKSFLQPCWDIHLKMKPWQELQKDLPLF